MGMIEVIDVMGDDMRVINAARVSFNKHSDFSTIEDAGKIVKYMESGDYRLIKYLLKHNHFTPFTHPQLTLRIKMPIFIARQWFKHQIGLSRNEVSRRYVSYDPEFYMPDGFREMAENKKQGSSDVISAQSEQLVSLVHNMNDKAEAVYQNLLACNICPEQARMVLPQSMMTEFFETGSLQAYLRIMALRTSPDAQKEVRDYGEEVGTIIKDLFPYTYDAVEELQS